MFEVGITLRSSSILNSSWRVGRWALTNVKATSVRGYHYQGTRERGDPRPNCDVDLKLTF